MTGQTLVAQPEPSPLYGAAKLVGTIGARTTVGLISALTLPSGGTSDYAPEMIHAAAKGEPYDCFVRPDTTIPFMAMPDGVEALLTLANDANKAAKFESTFMVSALTGDGVMDLKTWLAQRVPPGPWLYPADQMSDAPIRQLAAEITREKLFKRLHQELPYHSTVETEVWKELRAGDIRIEQTIYVERESQRKIVLGKGGQTIKAIGAESRKEIAEILGMAVHLFLFVKVRENWGDDPDRYRNMGLEFPKE